MVEKREGDSIKIRMIEEDTKRLKGLLPQYLKGLEDAKVNPEYGRYAYDEFDRSEMTKEEQETYDKRWNRMIDNEKESIIDTIQGMEEAPRLMREYGVDGYFATVAKVDHPWIPSDESEWKNSHKTRALLAQDELAAAIGYTENPSNAFVHGPASKNYRAPKDHSLALYGSTSVSFQPGKVMSLNPENINKWFGALLSQRREATKLGAKIKSVHDRLETYGMSKDMNPIVRKLYESKGQDQQAQAALADKGYRYIEPPEKIDGRNYHKRLGCIQKGKIVFPLQEVPDAYLEGDRISTSLSRWY